jgi:O-antigen/teichoic acid export membrane protein
MIGAFGPRLSRLSNDNPARARIEAYFVISILAAFGIFIGTIFLVESDTVVKLVYGNKYVESTDLVRFMGIAVIFNYAIWGYSNTLISFGQDRFMIYVVSLSAFLSVVGGIILVPLFGATGSAIVVSLIDLSGCIVCIPFYNRTIGSIHTKSWVLPIIGGLLLSLFLYILRSNGISPSFRLFIGFLFYSPVFYYVLKRSYVNVIY